MDAPANRPITVVHEPESHRFVTCVDGHECRIDYTLESGLESGLDSALGGEVMTLTHTFVAPELRGHGVAAELTRFTLATARANGWRVVPQCSYAALYVRRHPEAAMLCGVV